MDKFNISENIVIREIKTTTQTLSENNSSQKPNAYYLRNSQYLKKEERDPVLVRSYQRGGYLVPITCPDVLEKYQERFSYELVYDPIIDEPLPVQKLLSLKSWKNEEQRLRFFEIAKRCQQLGIKVSESKSHPDYALGSLLREYKDIEEQTMYFNINELDLSVKGKFSKFKTLFKSSKAS